MLELTQFIYFIIPTLYALCVSPHSLAQSRAYVCVCDCEARWTASTVAGVLRACVWWPYGRSRVKSHECNVMLWEGVRGPRCALEIEPSGSNPRDRTLGIEVVCARGSVYVYVMLCYVMLFLYYIIDDTLAPVRRPRSRPTASLARQSSSGG